MNRSIEDAAVKHHHHEGNDPLRQPLGDSLIAYNFDRRLKTLRGQPYDAICKAWLENQSTSRQARTTRLRD